MYPEGKVFFCYRIGAIVWRTPEGQHLMGRRALGLKQTDEIDTRGVS